MITLWRRTLNRADLRVELRDGALAMAHFDNRQDALDWLSKHVADEEGRISGQLSEIADEQESVQEMRDFLTDAREHHFVGARVVPEREAPEPYTEQVTQPVERRIYVGHRRRAGDRRVNRFSPAEDTNEKEE